MSANNQEQPGLVASHAAYVKGVAVDAVGSITGSEEWKKSGHDQKEEAIEHMKTASQSRDPAKDGFGKPEETAGKLFGCEGMQNEGAESKK